MSRSTPTTPRAGTPTPGTAGGAQVNSLLEQRARNRSELGTLARAQWRQGVIFLLIVAVLGALLVRTAYWQLSQQRTLAGRADAEHVRAISLPTGRGEILDARGRVLAVSVTEDTVIADPDVIRSERALDAVAQTLAQALGLPAALVRGQLDVPGVYVRLRDADGQMVLATQAQSEAIGAAIGSGTLPGIALIPAVRRVYPAGDLAAQALGFVRVSDGAGQYGVEQQWQTTLAGKPGVLYTAVDAAGNPLATGARRETPAVPGANVTLTLDASVQYWAEQGLADAIAQTHADGGTVIVMDPHTGALVALANLPSFDPNVYGSASLVSFNDPAVSMPYDPGSVMKGVTIAAGIDAGVITPDTVYDDAAPIKVGGVAIHNWDQHNYGRITMTQVLQYSVNTGAIWVAQQVGRDGFDRYLSAFGFGQRTGVDLPAESAGLLAQPQSRSETDLLMAENAFGESIGVTPLQMVAAYGALANGGVLMRPYVVASVASTGGQGAVTRYGPHMVRQVVSAETAQTVTQMLVQSAYQSEAEMYRMQGYTVAAKTGTSTPDPANPQVTYASVIGYAPASNPRFVLLVKLDHPRTTIFGGTAAGPLWRSLAEQLFVYDQIAPDAGTTGG